MLKDKVVLITGGAGNLGQEFVRTVVENHGTAIIGDINKEAASKLKDKLSLELKSDNIDFVDMNITDKSSIEKAINYIHNKHKKIDALINNAYPRNKNYGRDFFEVEHCDFIENIGLNLGGYFTTSQQLAKYFKSQGHGNIINISSIYGAIPPKFELYEGTSMSMPVEYAAIKSALNHLTKYMAKYFSGMNIRVNTLSPGGILNNQPQSFLEAYRNNCLGKGMLENSDLNGSLIYLLSDMSKHMNGQNLIVDDGFSL